MLKLVATDLDGTLIPPSKVIPEETFPLIEKLYKKGVIFVAASGRQLPNLKKQFAPVLDKIAIIAENGGLVWYGGKIIYSQPTSPADVKRALKIIDGEKGLHPLLSCVDCAYHSDTHPQFVAISEKSYSSMRKVDNLEEIADREQVLKISVWDEFPPCRNHGGIVLPPKTRGLRTIVSGYDWLDVSTPLANKGEALKSLIGVLGIPAADCAAFGDQMNDLEMLLVSGMPFVTANGDPELKRRVGSIIPSNAEFGVINKIKEFLL